MDPGPALGSVVKKLAVSATWSCGGDTVWSSGVTVSVVTFDTRDRFSRRYRYWSTAKKVPLMVIWIGITVTDPVGTGEPGARAAKSTADLSAVLFSSLISPGRSASGGILASSLDSRLR